MEGELLSCTQYADNITAFLPEEDSLPAFLGAMDVFGAATGQRLNPAKSKAMMMGSRTLPEVPPDAVLPWVRSAKALGVTFHEGVGQPTIDWSGKVAAVERRLHSLAALPMSAMGRGLACAAYGVSQLLFHAEFGGMPPHQLLRGLTSTIAAYVDSGVAPGQQVGPRFAGVAADLLVGSPKEGGFGVLPLAQHIRARHAAWGARLACALAQTCPPPWAMVARCALASFPHACHPFAIMAWRPLQLERALLPAPFLRLLDGLAALPPVEDVHPDALAPGAWCACAPMWLNPLMPGGAGQVLDVEFADLANSGITTVAELAAGAVAVTQASNREEFLAARAIHLPQNWPAFLDRHRTHQQLHHCVARLSQPWLQAAQNHSPPPVSAFHEVALPRLGWRLAQGTVQLDALSVRQATQAQLEHVQQRQQQRHADFVGLVLTLSGRPRDTPLEERAAMVTRLLRGLWQLPWDNGHKEVYWRLRLDALPTAARRHAANDKCCCGSPCPDRMHHYWACPAAAALQGLIATHLQRRGMLQTSLQAAHILLAQPPSPRLHKGVWHVVCLAAICALDHVRRASSARALAGVQAGQLMEAGAPLAARMADRAVARFWDLLTDFCVLDQAPPAWQQCLCTSHPFITWQGSWTVVRSLP